MKNGLIDARFLFASGFAPCEAVLLESCLGAPVTLNSYVKR